MTARDTARTFGLGSACDHLYRHISMCPVCTPGCPHLSQLDLMDGRVCFCEIPDGRSWDDVERDPHDWPTWLLPAVLLATALAMLIALWLGQTWQDDRCEQAATTATPCVGWEPS